MKRSKKPNNTTPIEFQADLKEDTKVYSFRSGDAVKYGINSAIILYNLRYWLDKNRANETNIYEGQVWTYNSIEAFSKLLPFLTSNQIEYALNKLRKEGLLLTGNFNKNPYDRTVWYSINEPQYRTINIPDSIPETSEMEKENFRNGKGELPKSISDNNPDNNPDISKYHSSRSSSSESDDQEKEDPPPRLKNGKPSIKERNKKYVPYAKLLSNIIRSKKNISHSAQEIKSWANEIRKLSEMNKVSRKRIRNALYWYRDNIGGQYIPVIESGSSLRKKFMKLEDAIKRDKEGFSKSNKTSIGYREKGYKYKQSEKY